MNRMKANLKSDFYLIFRLKFIYINTQKYHKFNGLIFL